MDAFEIFILIKNLAAHSTELQSIIDDIQDPEYDDPLLTASINYFSASTKSIEILFKSHLITVYFPVQPITRYLSKNTRTRLMIEIPRESANEKIEGLVEEAEGVFDEMEHMAYLKNQPFNFS